MNGQGKKVFVGMSGGVDSSVSAALLKKQGYDVTGVFIKVWNPLSEQGSTFLPIQGRTLFGLCEVADDRLDVMRVCAKLNIPFVELNLEKEYKKEVVDYMIREYKAGRTPNPDVMCNRHVKFGGFYKWARKKGADFIATGHYTRVASDATREAPNPKSQITNKSQILNSKKQTGYQLLAGKDENKDQSYFLWQIRKEQLPHILFPVGGMRKPEVRKLAKRFGLPTAEKKDSQGLCFLGKIDVKEFLKNHIKSKRGNVVNNKGEVIGEHDGAVFFTLGERHGFRVTRNEQPKRSDLDNEAKPYYVVAKDAKKNTLTVSHDPKASAQGESRTVFEIKETNWIGGTPPVGRTLSARIRYRQPLQVCKILPRLSASSPRQVRVAFSERQAGAAGQSIVFYDDSVCLGGGVIC